MANHVDWEWDVEHCDANGDVVDHLFQFNYADCVQVAKQLRNDGRQCSIVLVCSIGNEHDGVADRSWAYVSGDRLPEYTSTPDEQGRYCDRVRRVPLRFAREVK